MYLRDGQTSTVSKFTVGTGGVTKGDLVVLSSNTVVKAAAAPSAGTVLGIATETAVATAVTAIELAQGRIVSSKFTNAGTKKTFTDADLSKIYDISDSQTINPDDTTGGCAFLVGYDNDLLLAHFILTPASRAI